MTDAPPFDPPALDYASSPTLGQIRELAGERAALDLVAARGGTRVHLPHAVTPECALARICGVEAAQRLVQFYGAGTDLPIPTGRGFRHGRRIDHARVAELHRAGQSGARIARAVGCTERQVWAILRRHRGPDLRQPDLFAG